MAYRKKKKDKEKDPSKHVIVTRTLLVKLNKLTSDEILLKRFTSAVYNCHEIVSDAYTFIKLYLLEEFERLNLESTESHHERLKMYSKWLVEKGPWRKDFFGHVLSVLTSPLAGKRQGRPFTKDNQVFIQSIQTAYQRYADQGLFSIDISTRRNLSHVLTYIETSMKTAFENNIKMHFDKYVKRIIRALVFKQASINHNVERFYDLDYKIQSKYKALANCSIKWILFSGSPPEDNEMVEILKKNIIDKALPYPDSNIYEHLHECPLHLSYMMFMNREIEIAGGKTLSPIPLRRQFIPCNITLDTAALVDLVIDQGISFQKVKDDLEMTLEYAIPNLTNKGQMFNNPNTFVSEDDKNEVVSPLFKTAIWRTIFDFSKPSIRKQFQLLERKGLVFNNMMTFDGYKVDLHFTDKKSFLAERFKKGSILNGAKREQTEEFKYIQNMNDDERKEFEDPKIKLLYCDGGKGNIATITDGVNKKSVMYTSLQRQVEMETKRNRKELEYLKSKCKIEDGRTIKEVLESKDLCDTNSKSCFFDNFKKYRLARLGVEPLLKEFFLRSCHRRRRLRARIGKTSSEELLINKIVNTFDLELDEHKKVTNAILVWGNWGLNPNLKNQPPTPGIGLRRVVHKRIKTYTCDERGTSSYCPKCESTVVKEDQKMVFAWDKKTRTVVHRVKPIHHLLRCTNEKCKSRWWNRDILATYNIRKQSISYFHTGQMHQAFKKPVKKLVEDDASKNIHSHRHEEGSKP
jgi:hypothetical protein